jgi:hypothetical protein
MVCILNILIKEQGDIEDNSKTIQHEEFAGGHQPKSAPGAEHYLQLEYLFVRRSTTICIIRSTL